MQATKIQFSHSSKKMLAAATLAVSLAISPLAAMAGEKMGRMGHEDRSLLRTQQMHDRLMITATQEEQWGKVAKAMNDNAKTMDTLTQVRVDQAKGMTAVDDLKSYGEITEAHAAGIRTLTPLFANLYDTMSDPQKKQADIVFRHGGQKSRHHNRGPKNMDAKSATRE